MHDDSSSLYAARTIYKSSSTVCNSHIAIAMNNVYVLARMQTPGYVKESDKISEAKDSNKSESEAAPLRRG